MLKKGIFSVCCFLPLAAWSINSSVQQENELKAVEQEIQILKKRWHHINLEQMKEEVEGQGYMIANWEAYRRELELIRKQELEDNQIEQRIKHLEERKAQLLQRKQNFN